MLPNQQTQKQKEPGMLCPRCNFFILFTIEDILYKTEFTCPGCSLKLTLNRSQSRESLEALQQLHVAIKNLESVKHFKR